MKQSAVLTEKQKTKGAGEAKQKFLWLPENEAHVSRRQHEQLTHQHCFLLPVALDLVAKKHSAHVANLISR